MLHQTITKKDYMENRNNFPFLLYILFTLQTYHAVFLKWLEKPYFVIIPLRRTICYFIEIHRIIIWGVYKFSSIMRFLDVYL